MFGVSIPSLTCSGIIPILEDRWRWRWWRWRWRWKLVMMMKVGDDDGFLVMKVVQPWKLSSEESYLVMKVIIVKEVITCDVSPVAMFTMQTSIRSVLKFLRCLNVFVWNCDECFSWTWSICQRLEIGSWLPIIRASSINRLSFLPQITPKPNFFMANDFIKYFLFKIRVHDHWPWMDDFA